MGLLSRFFNRRPSNEQIALELTERLAEAFSSDPDVQICEPMTWEQTLAWLKSIELDEQEEEQSS